MLIGLEFNINVISLIILKCLKLVIFVGLESDFYTYKVQFPLLTVFVCKCSIGLNGSCIFRAGQ